MALSSCSLFEKYLKSTEETQTVAIKILSDILTQYYWRTRKGDFGVSITCFPNINFNLKILQKTLAIFCDLFCEITLPPASLTCLCVGMAKLILHNIVNDPSQLNLVKYPSHKYLCSSITRFYATWLSCTSRRPHQTI